MNALRVIFLFILILIALPFEFYHFIPGVRRYIMILIHGLFLLDLYRNGRAEISNFSIMFLITGYVAFSILYAVHNHTVYIQYLIQFTAVFFILIYIDTFKLYSTYIKAYLTVLFVTGIGGIVGFIIALSGIEPYSEVQTPSRLLYFYYTTLTPTFMDFGSFNLIRFSGFFDEPGKFAYYHLFGLYFAYLNNYSKKFLILFALIGLFTTSLAYIVSIVAAAFFFLLSAYRISIKKMITIVMVSLFIYSIFNINRIYPNDVTDSLNWFISSRLSFDADRSSNRLFAGDNRTVNILYSLEVFKENPIFGHDKFDPSYNHDLMVGNLFVYFARHGIVGVIALYFMFGYLIVYILTRNMKISIYLIFFLIILNFYQRPYFSQGYMGYLLIPTLIYSIRYYHQDQHLEEFDKGDEDQLMTK